MLQPLGVIGWNYANPSDIIEFNILNDILIMLVFASPKHSSDSTACDTSKTTVSPALFKSTVLRELSMFSM